MLDAGKARVDLFYILILTFPKIFCKNLQKKAVQTAKEIKILY